MSSNKRKFKSNCEDCESCKNFPRFRVSSCPQEPTVPQNGPEPPVFSPVYGSLYRTSSTLSSPGTNVDFDTVGPSSGVTLDIVGNSITVNSTGVYTITFSTIVNAIGVAATLHVVLFGLRINGIDDTTKQAIYQTEILTIPKSSTISRTDQVMLNEGDVIQIRIVASTVGNITYDDSALVVTKVA
ncbi:hypothetical protein AAHH17_12770 [Lysinibacillus capsici]|uniref:hypothetical protein n=1 Tax=Lysinibacillus capsici TaxID=2115968 RepID=UPI0032E4BB93